MSVEVIADRFELVVQVARGGMGTVYRAVDLQTRGEVALKLLDAEYDRARFEQEAAVLAELAHPRIVRYIAHGHVDRDRAYLAMEWLAGEDLGDRLARGPFALGDALRLVRSLADGLAAAHARGIVHRDIKPSNVFLRDSKLEGATLLDFGVARRVAGSRGARTRTGALVGTPGYMAPEQAGLGGPVGTAADVFALGCVLHECIAGQAPFHADHLVGVLAKILFAEPPALAIPEPVARVLALMLAKDPARRLRDAAAVVEAIDACGDLGAAAQATVETPIERASVERLRVESAEQQLVCMIVATVPGAVSDTLLERYGLERLLDGTLVAMLTPTPDRVATDLAVHAARIALALQAEEPQARVALAMRRGVVEGRLPVGEVIDRASAQLPAEASILVDELSAALLARHFQVTQGSRLVGEHPDADALHLLLGKPTPCLGREQELTTLETALATCIDQRAVAAYVVTGPAGMGKSRLRHELTRRVQAHHPDVLVINGIADVANAGASFGVISSVLGALARKHDVVTHVAPASRSRVRELVAELRGEPVLDPSPELLAARADPRRLGDDMAAAVLDVVRAEISVHPVMLVLEDLHWADRASIKLIERALAELAEEPLFVVGLARSDKGSPPWSGVAVHLPLRPLGKRACERLVADVLGDVGTAMVGRIVEQAAGNALFLEELIRAISEGRRDLPDTVLAILQSRIAGLPAELRRVLRAASVFGERFTRDGVAALVGEPLLVVDEHLAELERREIVAPRDGAFAFRHGLVGDAAYALLSKEEREVAHRAAAAYLETEGGHEPSQLADHHFQACAYGRAVEGYIRAGAEANAVGDAPAARVHLSAASDALRMLPGTPAWRRKRVDILLQQVALGVLVEMPALQLARAEIARDVLAELEPEPADIGRGSTLDLLAARLLLYTGYPARARAMCEPLVELATRTGDEQLAIATTQVIGDAWLMGGNVRLAEPLLATGRAHADHVASGYDRVRIVANHAMCLCVSGRYREGRALHAEALRMAEATRQASCLTVALTTRAGSESVVGDPRERATIAAALEQARRSNERIAEQLMLAQLALLEARHGNQVAAGEASRESLAIFDELGGQLCYYDLRVGSDALLATRGGRHDAAIEIARDAIPTFREEGLELGLGLAEQAWGLALAAKGDPEAETHLAAAHHVFETSGQAFARARLELAWARLGGPRAAAMRAAAVATYTEAGHPELVALLDETP